MARVVRPGGAVIVGDLVADEATATPPSGARRSSACAIPRTGPAGRRSSCGRWARRRGSTLEHEQLIPLDIDFDDWLARGSGGAAAAPLVDELLAQRPREPRASASPPARRGAACSSATGSAAGAGAVARADAARGSRRRATRPGAWSRWGRRSARRPARAAFRPGVAARRSSAIRRRAARSLAERGEAPGRPRGRGGPGIVPAVPVFGGDDPEAPAVRGEPQQRSPRERVERRAREGTHRPGSGRVEPRSGIAGAAGQRPRGRLEQLPECAARRRRSRWRGNRRCRSPGSRRALATAALAGRVRQSRRTGGRCDPTRRVALGIAPVDRRADRDGSVRRHRGRDRAGSPRCAAPRPGNPPRQARSPRRPRPGARRRPSRRGRRRRQRRCAGR